MMFNSVKSLKEKVSIIGLSIALLAVSGCTKTQQIESDLKEAVVEAPKEIIPVLSLEEQFPHVMKRNVPLYSYLRELEVPAIDIIEMAKAAKQVKSLSVLRPGTRFNVLLDDDKNLLEASFRFSAVEKLILKKDTTGWTAETFRENIDTKTVSFVGEVKSTLWESAVDSAMDPYLISEMAEIFGWEVDFSRQVRRGDKWRLTAEKKFVKGQHVGWGSILAAEYINQGVLYTAVLFRQGDEDLGYYSIEGENLRKMFLKSPLKFGRVTSHFNRRRFHPKLKIFRAHNGVDYGAPIGTPVRSVADGVVRLAARRGGGGKILKIRHNSTYQTAYKHLNGYARGIRRGVRVKQGQIVAYTGNTGLSTGPHLHFELYKNGRYVDPLRQKFPSAKPLSAEKKEMFLVQSKRFTTLLPAWNSNKLDMNPETSWSEYLVQSLENKLQLKSESEKFVFKKQKSDTFIY